MRPAGLVLVLGVVVGCGSVSNSGDDVDDGVAADAATGADGDPGDRPDAGGELVLCSHDDPFVGAERVLGTNTTAEEMNPWLSADERTIVFSRVPVGQTDLDLYVATRGAADGTFDTPQVLDEIDLGREYRASLSADLETIYFDRRPAAGGAYDIFVATRDAVGDDFSGEDTVANVSGAETNEFEPFVADDGMYFGSTRDGEPNLFRAPVSGDGFGNPVPLDAVNTGEDEELPIVSADGHALYFAGRDRQPGGVGWDVWMATRDNLAGDFTDATRVADPVSGDGMELPGWISPDNCRLYFASDRGAGDDTDLWMARRAAPE